MATVTFGDWEGFTVSGDNFCIGSGEFLATVYVDEESVALLKEYDGGYCLEGTTNREFFYGLPSRKRKTAMAAATKVVTDNLALLRSTSVPDLRIDKPAPAGGDSQ